MSKKVLVTGADGFIGSHLVNDLVKNGYEVSAFCLYNSFSDIGWLNDLDSEILDSVQIIFGDIRDLDTVDTAVKDIDIIFHLAALIAIPYSYIAPRSYVDTNITGTLNILQASLKNNIEQLIHTSSSEVYGTAQFVPITELHPLVGQSPYAATKISADQLAYSFYRSFGLPVSIVRPFNTYGPRQSDRAVIPTIIKQAIKSNKKILLGNINSTRDFNFVLDTVSGMRSFIGNTNTIGEVINLGTGVEVTIHELVKIISKISNFNIEIELDKSRLRPKLSEVDRLCACNKKAKSLLSWSPSFNLEEGLKITYDWFAKN
jgi:NAD dependent epimerase/dehydratase